MTDRRNFLKNSLLGATASVLAWGGKLSAAAPERCLVTIKIPPSDANGFTARTYN